MTDAGETTAVSKKRVLYVGGLDEKVDEAILHAAFIPFGPIRDVQIPLDYVTQHNKGFGFVEFEEDEDAAAAMENMSDAELVGRVIKVNIARPIKAKIGSSKPVWAEADDWYSKKVREEEFDMVEDVEAMAKLVHRDTLEPEH